MANLDPKVNEIRGMYKRVVAVIQSCTSIDQLDVARKYANLAIKQWQGKIPKSITHERHQELFKKVVKNIDDYFKLKKKILRSFNNGQTRK
jgi:hypothetical protein